MTGGRHEIQQTRPRHHAPSVILQRAANGMWTACVRQDGAPPVYLHSRYDPMTEAGRFAAAQLSGPEEENPDLIVLYGAGCGHHVKAILERTKVGATPVEVWETNVASFLHMDEQEVFGELKAENRLRFVVSDDLQSFSGRVRAWKGIRVRVIVHEPSLRAMPDEFAPLRQILQDYQIMHNSAIRHRELLQDNFLRNHQRNWPSLQAFRGLPQAPAILISAGPSLSRTLPALPKAAKHALLGSVGTAAALLHRHNIRPDFVVMTDPQSKMLDQLKGWHSEDIPLFFMSTLYAEAAERYPGPRFILYQQGYEPAERIASERGEPLVATGGSVSTALFSVARLLGLGPLCLVGQDLAYTDSMTHAEGTPLYRKWESPAAGERVRSFDRRGSVVSSRNLLLYKKWFEEQARGCRDTFYNATEGGAYIEGFQHVSFAEFLMDIHHSDATEAREYFARMVRDSTLN